MTRLDLEHRTPTRRHWNVAPSVVAVNEPLASASSDPSPIDIAYTLDVVSPALQAITT